MRGLNRVAWGLALALAVTGCARKKKPSAAPDTDAPPPVVLVSPKPVVVAFRPDDAPPLSLRFAADDQPEVRLGPNRDYPLIAAASLQRGQRLYVMDETNAWIRVRADSEPGPSLGWINKFASMPAADTDTNLLVQEEDVALLRSIGLLMKVTPEINEAVIHTNLWNAQSLVVRRGMGRSLAFYCGLKKGSNTRWVQLTDSNSGKRIGRYSENSGYTDYSSLRRSSGL